MGDVIADLIRIALPALAEELDLDAIEPRPTEFVGLDRSKRIGDAAYRIPFLEDADRSAIAAAEFQSGPDAGMLDRTQGYTAAMLADFRRRGVLREDEHPLVLPFVIHTGTSRWSAADGTESLADQLKRERRRFAGPGELAFRQGMHAWVEEAVLAHRTRARRCPRSRSWNARRRPR